MTHHKEQHKEISWQVNDKRYVIQNVPLKVYGEDAGETTYESDVTLKLLLLKDLMEAEEIPSEIDFQIANEI